MIQKKLTTALLFFNLFFSIYSIADTPSIVIAKKGMVVTEQHLASDVGAYLLRAGGNAIDAAVGVGYALAVVNPCCGNLGGGGFMTIHLASGKDIFINFRERAPLAARPELFFSKGKIQTKKSTEGYLAAAVPGTVLGLDTVLNKYGTLPRKFIMAPAIALAEKGYLLQKGDTDILSRDTQAFRKQPNVAAIFLKSNQPYKPGDRLIQKDLANTLKLIAAKGSDAFYKGKIAKKIVQASHKNEGIFTLKDFSDYFIEETQPLHCSYRDYTFITAPPPSAGGTTLCEILNILEGYPLPAWGHLSPKGAYYIVKAMGLGFHDRNLKLGDPDFINNPVSQLISKQYANQLRKKIPAFESDISQIMKPSVMKEGVNTTHFSILDQYGNAVSVTYTLNSFFGAKVIAENTGFFLNSEMDDFSIGTVNKFGLQQGSKNKIAPGKRPLSSMSPTIIFNRSKNPSHPQKELFMILGSPGGPRIITATLLTILNVIDYKMNLQEAVNARRIHYQGIPNIVYTEKDALSLITQKNLIQRNLQIDVGQIWGAVEAIQYDDVLHNMIGVNDIRRPAGKAIGI